MKRYPPSGPSILVVGSGIGGLGFAIEAHRKGHGVRIVERRPNFHDKGRNADLGALLQEARQADSRGQHLPVAPHVVRPAAQVRVAAHPFLPTSAAGASMALEDGISLASCLQLGGRSNVPLALRVHNLFRFERVCCAQKIGFRNREMFHKADWAEVEKDRDSVGVFAGDWMGRHHVEQYVYDNHGNATRSILEGTPFENTNSVPGFKFRPWTVKELLEASDRGQPVMDEGEWF